MKNKGQYSVRRLMRTMVVMVVYEYELLNQKITMKEVYENDKFNEIFDYEKLNVKNKDEIYKEQLSIVSVIEKNYETFKKMISKFIREDWTWSRLSPLVRAILLCASVELWKLDIGIVTNEYVEITKDLVPSDETYKFVNSVIEKIGKEYDEFRKKKNKENQKKIERN